MKLVRNLRWAAIALGILGGSTNALACVVTPDSILTEGQTLQLIADCTNGGIDRIKTINWKMAIGTGTPVSITGDVVLNQPVPKKIYYTTPVGLTASGEYTFSVTGTYVVDNAPVTTADSARVVVMPSSAEVALALGVSASSTPIPAQCGSANGTARTTMPTGTAQCSAGTGSLAISGPSSFTWSCLSLNGGTEDNCYATRSLPSYTVTASAGAGGSISPSGSVPVTAGTTKAFTVTPNPTYSILNVTGCGGSLSGSTYTTGTIDSACSVTASFTPGAPTNYTVTASAGAGGSISPSGSVPVAAGTTKAFTVTPNPTYSILNVTGCGGSLSGSTYTTGTINSACSVTASFTASSGSGSGGDPGIGNGLWVPPGMDNRTVADVPLGININYVPGCLNTLQPPSAQSGCAAAYSFTGTLAGTSTPHTVSLGGGKQLVLRYRSKADAGTVPKYIRLTGPTGANVSPTSNGTTLNVRVWLSPDPAATYASVPAACKQTSTSRPLIITGPGYCTIASNTVYYYGIEYDEVPQEHFHAELGGSDFIY